MTQSATFDLTDDSPHFVCHARRCAWPRSTSVSSAALLRARPRPPIRSATSQPASARPRPGPTTSPRAVAPGEKAPPVALTTGATRPPWRRFRRARVPRSSSRSCARHSARAPGTNRPRIHPSSTRHRVPVSTGHPRFFQTHIDIKHQTHHSNLSPPSIQGYPQADPGRDPDATQGCAHVDPGPARRRHLQKVHRQELAMRLRFRQPTFNRRGRRRPSPGRAPDQLEGRRGRREHARHRWAVTARLCPGGQAGHDRRHVLTEVASRERGINDEAE